MLKFNNQKIINDLFQWPGNFAGITTAVGPPDIQIHGIGHKTCGAIRPDQIDTSWMPTAGADIEIAFAIGRVEVSTTRIGSF